MTTGTDLVVYNPDYLKNSFGAQDEIEKIVSQIERDVLSEAPDLTTAKGRKAVRSLAYKVAQTKTMMDEKGKALNDDKRAYINAVDADRRIIRDRLDALKAKVLAPVEEWEAREDARVDGHKRAIAAYSFPINADWTAEMIAGLIDDVAMQEPRDWQEFEEDATAARADLLERLKEASARAADHEAAQAELVALRAAAAERARQDAAREMAERAARESAEQKAEDERIKVETERRNAERERLEAERERVAEEKRLADLAAAEQRALARAKAAEEERRIEQERALAQERADRQREQEEREAIHKRELAAAKDREERAAQAERDRITAERKAEAEARSKREADAEHRASILADIEDALTGYKSANAMAKAILNGDVPHVRVSL